MARPASLPGEPERSAVAAVERVAVRAVPAALEHDVEGWLVAIGLGAVNRMNSTTTFGILPTSLDAAVDAVEDLTRQHGTTTRFRLTPLDARLDAVLARRGFVRSDDVVVMTMPFVARPSTVVDPRVAVSTKVTAAWLAGLRACGGYDEARVREIGESLGRLRLPFAAFGLVGAGSTRDVDADARPMAVGLAVRDGAWLGLFDVAVAPDHRRSGLGRAITTSMLAWGRAAGAERAYLQVHSLNEPAIALYHDLGFAEAYRYHYRTAA